MNGLTRRDALGGLGAAALAGCTTMSSSGGVSRPLGLANITVHKELAQDYGGTLSKIAAMGYTHFGFPLARMSPQMPDGPHPREIARMVRDVGMEVGVVRYGFAAPAEEQMAWASEIGASIVAYTAAPVFFRGKNLGRTTRSEFDAWLPELGKLGEIVQAAGLRLAYHNHWWDHVPLDGETPLDIIARTYSPDLVAFEIDLAWAWLGGKAPLDLIKSLGPRVASMHFKDVDPARGGSMFDQLIEPGQGKLDYAALVPRLDTITKAIGYVEVDNPADGLAAAESGAQLIRDVRSRHHD